MQIEYEATFTDINPQAVRRQLKKIGAKKIYRPYLQKRYAFHFPQKTKRGYWVRVRKEHDATTMSIKIFTGHRMEDQKELCLTIDSLEAGRKFLTTLGCRLKAYQENTRELWRLGQVEITIDHWPFLNPFVEIEGSSKKTVKAVSEKLGYQWSQAQFGSVTELYAKTYGVSQAQVEDRTPRIVFDMPNPFLKQKQQTKNKWKSNSHHTVPVRK